MSQYSDKKRGQTTAVSIPSEKRIRMQPPPSGPPTPNLQPYSSPPSPPSPKYYSAPTSPKYSTQYANIPTDNVRASAQTQSQIPISVAPVLSPCKIMLSASTHILDEREQIQEKQKQQQGGFSRAVGGFRRFTWESIKNMGVRPNYSWKVGEPIQPTAQVALPPSVKAQQSSSRK